MTKNLKGKLKYRKTQQKGSEITRQWREETNKAVNEREMER